MKASNKQVENAVLFFAKELGQEENFEAILRFHAGLPPVVESIVYEMFLAKFDPHSCTAEQREQYNLVYEYATELKAKGWVSFDL